MLTVVSWNVLAEAYVRRSYFPRTPASVLEPARRRAAVLDKLASFDADALCLQEVEPELFALASSRLVGFRGRFVAKRGKPDGCALFVRRDVSEWREIVYDDGSGHVAIAAIVDGVGIASTHLKWFPRDAPPAAHHGLAEMVELLDTWVRPDTSWIIAGDLNVEDDSDVLRVARERGLRDAYASMPQACTCNSNGRRKRIDYILATPDITLAPTPLPRVNDETPLPSDEDPSDHLPIEAITTRARAPG